MCDVDASQASVRELVSSPLIEHAGQLLEISVHASVSAILRSVLHNTTRCWSSLPLHFRPLSHTPLHGHAHNGPGNAGTDVLLLSNTRQLRTALELCMSLHHLCAAFRASDRQERAGLSLWHNVNSCMRAFLEHWPLIQTRWRQLHHLLSCRETVFIVGKEQGRALQLLQMRCLAQLAKVQGYGHLHHLCMAERDLVDHMPSLRASLDAAIDSIRMAVIRKRVGCARLFWLTDEELWELYRAWCASGDHQLLDRYIRVMFPALDGLSWNRLDEGLALAPGTGTLGQVLSARSVDHVEDIVFSEPLTRASLSLEAWVSALEEKIFNQVYTGIHYTWQRLQRTSDHNRPGLDSTVDQGDEDPQADEHMGLLPRLLEEGLSNGKSLACSELIVLQLAWAQDVSEALKPRPQQAPHTGIKRVLQDLVDCTAAVQRALWTKTRGTNPHGHAHLYVQLLHCRDVTSGLLGYGNGMMGSEDFAWTRHLRYQIRTMDGGAGTRTTCKKLPGALARSQAVTVGIGPWTFDYGYEYRDPRRRLVMAPLSERCLLNIATAMKQDRLPYICAEGYGFGAPFVAETLAVVLGRPQVSMRVLWVRVPKVFL